MYEVRCIHCRKLLLKANKLYEAINIKQCDLEVRCTSCKTMNQFKVK